MPVLNKGGEVRLKIDWLQSEWQALKGCPQDQLVWFVYHPVDKVIGWYTSREDAYRKARNLLRPANIRIGWLRPGGLVFL